MSRGKSAIALAVKTQRARQLAGMPTYGFLGDLVGGLGKVVTSIIPGPIDDIIFQGASDLLGGGKKSVAAKSSCPPGFRANPSTGVCEVEGVMGAVQRFLPGGQTGTLPQMPRSNGYGNAVVGSFGVPALQPAQASSVALRCPPGAVLGKDNLCYQKGSIPAQFRKWRPARKPPISAKDWKALQTADRVKNKAKNIAGKAGFTCRKR